MDNDGITVNRFGKEKILNLLGMAQKARRLVVGDAAKAAVDGGKAKIVIIANDASPRTVDKVIHAANDKDIRVKICFTKEELAKAVGKDGLTAVIAVTDEGFARSLEKLFTNER